MKRLLYVALALFALCAFESCRKYEPLLGTSWNLVRYDDYLDGSKIYGEIIGGALDFDDYGGETYGYLYVPDWEEDSYYAPDEYFVITRTSNELVVDIWYEESMYRQSECTPVDTFMGKKIYSTPDGGFCYFKSNGTGVYVYTDYDNRDRLYYYDTVRLTCVNAH